MTKQPNHSKKRSHPFLLILAIVLCLCAAAAVIEALFPAVPSTDAEQKVYQYAKENGLSYRDYPQSLIDLLERNPETEKFVLEYPTAGKETFSIDLSEHFNTGSVPLLMQWDQRWGYMKYGSDVAGLTACGPVCLSMAAIYLTSDPAYSPDAMIRFASENNYYVPGSGSSWTLISEGGKKLGFQVTELPLDEGRIRKCVEADIPVIIVVGPGDFTTSGHFLVITGYENGKFRLNDPNSRANSQELWAYENIKGQIRNLWSIENN
jgi:hypothetical protein